MLAADPRIGELILWAEGPVPASVDASFRRYFRMQKCGRSLIVMDAPPDKEDSVPFIRVAGYLESMGLNAPRVLEADLERGFLLLNDLGSTQYLARLREEPASADRLYDDALGALARLQSNGAAFQSLLPPYDEALLRFELSLFHDWLCGTHLGIEFGDTAEGEWKKLCDVLLGNALDQPQVFVHRDYHSRNLMVTAEESPGILDFQDAVEGPLTYDLVSLLKDCYIRWPGERIRNWAHEFFGRIDKAILGSMAEADFMRNFELMGVQRHLKAAGIFARLNHRDGKPGYLLDVPRTLSYIVDLAPRYPELDFLVNLISDRCLPALDEHA
jgi:aminoglycoside/choline kinase family phosphotransferase